MTKAKLNLSELNQKDLKLILDWCKAVGLEVIKTNGGHTKVKIPNGKFIITSSTPSDIRSALNFRSILRRELRISLEDSNQKKASK